MATGLRTPFSHKEGFYLRFSDMPSQCCASRTVDVWCPPNYADSPAQRYPVIYMHDGQNLFDPALSFIGVAWDMDEAVCRVMARYNGPGAIIVGIWNSPLRYREYMPQRPFTTGLDPKTAERFIREKGGTPISDAYLRFIVQELKPFVDRRFRTRPEPAATWLMGSSMGGLISLYALELYPDIFGAAACLSTHWPIGGASLVDALGCSLPSPLDHKIYFDFGTQTQDAAYEPFQHLMDAHMQAAGYESGRNWLTQKFEGHDHSERAWRSRVTIPLTFLLGLSRNSP